MIPCTKYKELHFMEKLLKHIHVTEQQYIFIYKCCYNIHVLTALQIYNAAMVSQWVDPSGKYLTFVPNLISMIHV